MKTSYKLNFVALLLVTVFCSAFLLVTAVSASSGNWVEVTRFSGLGNDFSTTDYFTVDYVEWRIRWEYVPDPRYPSFAMFGFFTYQQEEDESLIDIIMQTGNEKTDGLSYIHNKKGTFYIKLNNANTESYTIIIEQDLSSIPEFPTWMTGPILIITAAAVIIARRKLDQN